MPDKFIRGTAMMDFLAPRELFPSLGSVHEFPSSVMEETNPSLHAELTDYMTSSAQEENKATEWKFWHMYSLFDELN